MRQLTVSRRTGILAALGLLAFVAGGATIPSPEYVRYCHVNSQTPSYDAFRLGTTDTRGSEVVLDTSCGFLSMTGDAAGNAQFAVPGYTGAFGLNTTLFGRPQVNSTYCTQHLDAEQAAGRAPTVEDEWRVFDWAKAQRAAGRPADLEAQRAYWEATKHDLGVRQAYAASMGRDVNAVH